MTKNKSKQKTTPSLEERGLSPKDVMQKAKRVDNDEFYTRYEDIEKELSMEPVPKLFNCAQERTVLELAFEKSGQMHRFFPLNLR